MKMLIGMMIVLSASAGQAATHFNCAFQTQKGEQLQVFSSTAVDVIEIEQDGAIMDNLENIEVKLGKTKARFMQNGELRLDIGRAADGINSKGEMTYQGENMVGACVTLEDIGP